MVLSGPRERSRRPINTVRSDLNQCITVENHNKNLMSDLTKVIAELRQYVAFSKLREYGEGSDGIFGRLKQKGLHFGSREEHGQMVGPGEMGQGRNINGGSVTVYGSTRKHAKIAHSSKCLEGEIASDQKDCDSDPRQDAQRGDGHEIPRAHQKNCFAESSEAGDGDKKGKVWRRPPLKRLDVNGDFAEDREEWTKECRKHLAKIYDVAGENIGKHMGSNRFYRKLGD